MVTLFSTSSSTGLPASWNTPSSGSSHVNCALQHCAFAVWFMQGWCGKVVALAVG